MRDIGRLPLAMLKALGVDVLTVSEHAIERAIALLVEGAKQVAEGAGAAGLALWGCRGAAARPRRSARN